MIIIIDKLLYALIYLFANMYIIIYKLIVYSLSEYQLTI